MSKINTKYATIYLLLNSNPSQFLSKVELIQLFQSLLSNSFETNQSPSIENVTISAKPDDDFAYGVEVTSGPFKGYTLYDGYGISAIKWNIKGKSGKIPSELFGAIRDTFRKTIQKQLGTNHFGVLQFSINHYGAPLTGDRGIPKTPRLPKTIPPKPVEPPKPVVDPIPFDPTPKPAPTPPVVIVEPVVVVKKKSNAALWFLAIAGGLYAMRRGID